MNSNNIFNPDNKFFRQLGRLTDVLGLSILWLFTSAPIFTVGFTTAALYDAVVFALREDGGSPYRRYWYNLQKNWRAMLGWTCIWAVISAWLWYAYNYLLLVANTGNRIAAVIFVAFGIVACIPLGIAMWSLLIISRRQESLKTAGIMGAKLTFSHLPTTVILLMLLIETINFVARFLFSGVIVPALLMLIMSLFVEKIFAKHTSPDA